MIDTRVVRLAELEVEPRSLPDYLAFLREEIAASVEVEPGVLVLHAVQLRDAPHMIRLLEVYASQSAYEAHIQSPHFLKYKTGTAGMMRSLRLIDVDPIALGAKG